MNPESFYDAPIGHIIQQGDITRNPENWLTWVPAVKSVGMKVRPEHRGNVRIPSGRLPVYEQPQAPKQPPTPVPRAPRRKITPLDRTAGTVLREIPSEDPE